MDVGCDRVESVEQAAFAEGLLGVGALRVARLRIDRFFPKRIFIAGPP
jgi:hypothetical protein